MKPAMDDEKYMGEVQAVSLLLFRIRHDYYFLNNYKVNNSLNETSNG